MISARRRMLHLGTGLAVVAALTACQGPDDDPVPSDSPTTPPAEATPSPEETGPAPDPATESPEPTGTTPPDQEEIPADAAVNGPNAVVEPLNGASVTGPSVTVRGQGTAYEGTLHYEVVLVETDEIVAADFTQTGANGEVGPFEFTVDLAPGTYQIRVFEPQISDTEPGDAGPYVNLVEVTVTVT